MTTETTRRRRDLRGDVMRQFAKLARSLMLSALAACVITVGAPCAAEEPDPPDSTWR